MKKNSAFVSIVIVAALVAAVLLYSLVFGAGSHFTDPAVKEHPKDIMGIIYTGGIIVPLLLMLTIMVFTFIIERFFSLAKAKGSGDLNKFLHDVETSLNNGNIDAAVDLCNKQRGTVANIVLAGLERFKELRAENRLDA